VNVVSDELAEMLGYAPQADAMLQEVATGRRVWVELEVSLIQCQQACLSFWIYGLMAISPYITC
jgi:hypothetical protein